MHVFKAFVDAVNCCSHHILIEVDFVMPYLKCLKTESTVQSLYYTIFVVYRKDQIRTASANSVESDHGCTSRISLITQVIT